MDRHSSNPNLHLQVSGKLWKLYVVMLQIQSRQGDAYKLFLLHKVHVLA